MKPKVKPTWEHYKDSLADPQLVQRRGIAVLGMVGDWKGRQTRLKQQCLKCDLIWEKGNIGNALCGSGCPICRLKKAGRKRNVDNSCNFLYLMKVDEGYKFGITCNLERRLYDNRQKTVELLLYFAHEDSGIIRKAESLLKVRLPCGFFSEEDFGPGWTETTGEDSLPKMAEILKEVSPDLKVSFLSKSDICRYFENF